MVATYTILLTEEQKVLIEKLGVFYEKSGLTPASSRIVGLLLVADEVELTFDQVREALNLSKSATSNSLNALLNMNWIDYITKPGDRKRYFRNRLPSWSDAIEDEFKGMVHLSGLLSEVLALRSKETTSYNQDLADLIDFLLFANDEMSGLMAKWKASKKK